MEPVPSLLVRGPKRIHDPLVRNGRDFLSNRAQNPSAAPINKNAHVRASRNEKHKINPFTYISEGRVGLAQGLEVCSLRFAALEDGLAPLDPFDGGGGAQEDLLGLEAAGAGVGDDAV